MRRKNLLLTVAAAAVLGAFNPAFAQDSRDLTVNANPNVGVDTSVGSSNTDVNAGASTSLGVNIGSANQSSSSTMDQSAYSSQDGDRSIWSGVSEQSAPSSNTQLGSTDITLGGNIGPHASAELSQDIDRRTGLDRAHPSN